MTIPNTENAVVLRTDFSDQAAWDKICLRIRKPVGLLGFRANIEFLDDSAYAGISVEQLLAQLPGDYNHSFIILADAVTFHTPEHPLLVVELYENSGNSFRAIPRSVQGIENNLSLGNMDFEDFSSAVDADGIFRGFHSPNIFIRWLTGQK
jgi:hypothetical protein